MKKILVAAVAAATVLSGVLSAGAAAAQPAYYSQDRSYRDFDRDGRSGAREWNRDRNWDGRHHRSDRRRGANHGYRYYGGQYGYSGYNGGWRTGQRYPHYNSQRYMISDYRAYNLPPPRHGYRYYRDNNNDVVMAAIASGLIGLIIGGALSDGDHYDYPR